MRLSIALFTFIVFASTAVPADECRDAKGDAGDHATCADASDDSAAESSKLPKQAQAEVNELDARMRFFASIGFHAHSKEKRNAIRMIYEKHGVPVPERYRK